MILFIKIKIFKHIWKIIFLFFCKKIFNLFYNFFNKNLFLLIYLKENKIKNKIKYYTINLNFFFFLFYINLISQKHKIYVF